MATSARKVGRPAGVDADETRARILKEARACFAKNGYAATNNRMIAERVGLSTAAIHHHFGRKHELLTAIYEETQTRVYNRMRAAIDAADSFEDKMRSVWSILRYTLDEDPLVAVFETVIRPDLSRHPELADVGDYQPFIDLFVEVVQLGVDTGVVEESDLEATTHLIFAINSGIVSLAAGTTEGAHASITDACERLFEGRLINHS